MNNKGVFLTLEGPDGSGKTTHFSFLCEALRERGFRVKETRQPGGSEVAESIRHAILGTKYSEAMEPVVEAMLYAASRRQVLHSVINPAVEEGYVVVSDRWADSSFAYQGYGRGVLDEYRKIVDIAHPNFAPDMTLYFDVTLEESVKRIQARKKEYNRLNAEDLDFRNRCFTGYKTALRMHPERMHLIDSMCSPDNVREQLHVWLDRTFVPKYRHLMRYPR